MFGLLSRSFADAILLSLKETYMNKEKYI